MNTTGPSNTIYLPGLVGPLPPFGFLPVLPEFGADWVKLAAEPPLAPVVRIPPRPRRRVDFAQRRVC